MSKVPEFSLACPVCKSPLALTERVYRCAEGHAYDLARQGYVNLLMSHRKKSKNPGDDRAMVLARSAFLNQGYYAPFLQRVIENTLQGNTGERILPSLFLDVGCGEGYYTLGLMSALEASADSGVWKYTPKGIGLDISKEAILAACRRNQRFENMSWMVASGADIPVQTNAVDVLLCVFSRLMPAEFLRVLQPEGRLVVAGAAENHLQELRSVLYDEVRQKPFSVDAELGPGFRCIQRDRFSFRFTMNEPEDLDALLMMTPHGWRTAPDKKTRIHALLGKPITGDFQIEVWVPALESTGSDEGTLSN